MIPRQRILPFGSAVAATLLGVQGLLAQPSASPPVAKRPPVRLTMDEVNALMTRLRECWVVPVAMRNVPDLVVMLRINFKPDGSLARAPVVINTSQDPLFTTLAQSAARAVTKCAPYGFLPAAKYDAWSEIQAAFDPHDFVPRDKTK